MGSGPSLLRKPLHDPVSQTRSHSCGDYWDDEPFVPEVTVDGPSGPEWTGLFDKDGYPIFRERNPIGFIWFP